jgi:hypothetical protein
MGGVGKGVQVRNVTLRTSGRGWGGGYVMFFGP